MCVTLRETVSIQILDLVLFFLQNVRLDFPLVRGHATSLLIWSNA